MTNNPTQEHLELPDGPVPVKHVKVNTDVPKLIDTLRNIGSEEHQGVQDRLRDILERLDRGEYLGGGGVDEALAAINKLTFATIGVDELVSEPEGERGAPAWQTEKTKFDRNALRQEQRQAWYGQPKQLKEEVR